MKRRIAVGLAGLVAVGVAAGFLWPSRSGPCRATFEHVREGMTRDEVCATVGGLPSDDASRPTLGMGGGAAGPAQRAERWDGTDADLFVFFAPDGAASRVVVTDSHAPTMLGRLRDWIDP
jgi:hypothetical protein